MAFSLGREQGERQPRIGNGVEGIGDGGVSTQQSQSSNTEEIGFERATTMPHGTPEVRPSQELGGHVTGEMGEAAIIGDIVRGKQNAEVREADERQWLNEKLKDMVSRMIGILSFADNIEEKSSSGGEHIKTWFFDKIGKRGFNFVDSDSLLWRIENLRLFVQETRYDDINEQSREGETRYFISGTQYPRDKLNKLGRLKKNINPDYFLVSAVIVERPAPAGRPDGEGMSTFDIEEIVVPYDRGSREGDDSDRGKAMNAHVVDGILKVIEAVVPQKRS